MKNKKNKLSKTVALLSIVFTLTFSTNSHAFGWWHWWGNWGGNNYHRHTRTCGHNTGGHDSIPLDGGLSILLLGAAAFGVKKLRDNKNAEI